VTTRQHAWYVNVVALSLKVANNARRRASTLYLCARAPQHDLRELIFKMPPAHRYVNASRLRINACLSDGVGVLWFLQDDAGRAGRSAPANRQHEPSQPSTPLSSAQPLPARSRSTSGTQRCTFVCDR
jgi:hypothetical protein